MDEGQQKHQKVYSFLKRVLSQERYERIRAIEPCVIVANGFNKAFKFVILGDDRLYISENPPKLAKDVRIVIDLSSVTNIQIIHDVPEFLGGDLKNKAQHILITYKSPSLPSSSPRSQQTSTPIQHASTQGLASSLLTASALLRLGFDDELQPSSSGLYNNNNNLPRSKESTAGNLKVATRTKISVSEGSIPQLLEQERLDTYPVRTRGNHLSVPGRPLPPPPTGMVPSSSSQQYRKTRRKRQQNQELNSSSSSNELDFSSVREDFSNNMFSDGTNNTFSNRKGSWSSSNDHLERQRTSYSQYRKSKSVDDADYDVEPVKEVYVEEGSEEDIEGLHLYMLEQGSPMFVMLKNTWNNCIMKATSQYGVKSTTAGSKVDNSQLLTLFNQLKAEILHSHMIEKTFVLVNELLTAAQKSFSLKKYFWKSPELFQFIVDQIQLYLPHSPSRMSKRRGNNRADEFDYVVVLLDCLTCMFRETEVFISRLNVLKTNKGKAVKDLLQCILATPTKSYKSEPKISPAAQQLLKGSTEDFESLQREEETNQLLNEITDCATALLFELVLATHQSLSFAVENHTLNICWIVKIMDTSLSTELFLKRMMERKMSIISTTKKRISPKAAVLLYRQLYILHNIMDYSESMSTTIPRSFAEEFRYYIKASIIKKKLPAEYPLTPPILSLLDQVTTSVLKHKPRTAHR